MTQEKKNLLLKDLCARLLYNPWVLLEFEGSNQEWKTTLQQEYCVGYISGKITKLYSREITVKPYLRPMESMTEEEKRELSKKYVWDINYGQVEIRYHSDGYWDDNTECPTREYLNLFDWLNAHHFDYRGLIEKGLALEATKDMYKK